MSKLYSVYMAGESVPVHPTFEAMSAQIYIGTFPEEEANRVVRQHEMNGGIAWTKEYNPNEFEMDWIYLFKTLEPHEWGICAAIVALIGLVFLKIIM